LIISIECSNFRRSRNYEGAGIESLSPDNRVFVTLAKIYAQNHKTMTTSDECGDKFDGGITNGAHWYNVRGGVVISISC
jgi:hypothetical protein